MYGDEITSASCEKIENGCICDVFSQKDSWLGAGFYSENSKIKVRILSDNANETFDDAFWYRRLKYAVDYRLTVMRGDLSACRLVFGEADGMPGVTVDKFGDVLVAQIASYGMDLIKDRLFVQLRDILAEFGYAIRGIYEREDIALRDSEGLPRFKRWSEAIPHSGDTVTVITENGIKYRVDFENGQKTGYFLDQKFNRAEVARLAMGKKVLDCFTHTGSFALNAAMGGASHVTAVDVSESAVEMAKANAALNGLEDRMDFLCEDVFELLPRLEEKGGRPYDFIILDPPAFTKSRKTVNSAERGYKEINYRAMKLLGRGGWLATCSCSHFMRDDLFRKMIDEAAHDAGFSLKQCLVHQQSPDHPILRGVPETDYLKFYVFRIV